MTQYYFCVEIVQLSLCLNTSTTPWLYRHVCMSTVRKKKIKNWDVNNIILSPFYNTAFERSVQTVLASCCLSHISPIIAIVHTCIHWNCVFSVLCSLFFLSFFLLHRCRNRRPKTQKSTSQSDKIHFFWHTACKRIALQHSMIYMNYYK